MDAIVNLDFARFDPIADYSGTDRKDGIVLDGKRYMVKFSEKRAPANDLATSYVNNVVSEHVASRVIATLGLPVHHTFLGTIGGKLVVACENFVRPGEHLIEFGVFLRKRYDSADIARHPTLDQVRSVLNDDLLLSMGAPVFAERYWDQFVADALVGNFDRHMGNWGYLVTDTGNVSCAPIYDNGSSLYPSLSEDGMREVLANPREIARRVLLFPKAALEDDGVKLGYQDVLSSGIPEAWAAVKRIAPRINLTRIASEVDAVPITDIRKKFYLAMIEARLRLLIEPALESARTQTPDPASKARLNQHHAYAEADFERWWEDRGKGLPG